MSSRKSWERRHWVKVCMVGVGIILFLCLSPTSTRAKIIGLRFAYSMPPKVPPGNAFEWFASELEKRSQGRVKVTVFPGESLFKIKDSYESVVGGTADIANVSIKGEARRMRLAEVSLLPTLIFPDTVKGGIASSNAFLSLYTEFSEIRAEFRDVELLFVSNMPNEILHAKKPFRLPLDLRGKKIGSAGAVAELVDSIGGTSVYMPGPDAYLSVKSGVIDAQAGSWSLCFAYRLWEVAKYHLDYGLGQNMQAVVMNKKSWNGLPSDIQNVIKGLASETMAMGAAGLAERVERGKREATEHGNTIIKLTPAERKTWAEAGKPIEDKWLKKNKNNAAVAEKTLVRFRQMADASWK